MIRSLSEISGNFDVKDEPRSGRPITEKWSDEIMVKVERDKHVNTVEIARELGIDKTVLNHLHKGYKTLDTKRSLMFGFLTLSVRNMMDRINIWYATEWNWAISEENDNWWWKMVHLRQFN